MIHRGALMDFTIVPLTVDTAAPAHTVNLFTGTAAAFAEHGFRVVARRRPDRPVMRRDLSVVP